MNIPHVGKRDQKPDRTAKKNAKLHEPCRYKQTSTVAGDKGLDPQFPTSSRTTRHKSNAANKLDKAVRKEAPPSQAGAKLHYRKKQDASICADRAANHLFSNDTAYENKTKANCPSRSCLKHINQKGTVQPAKHITQKSETYP